MGSQRVRRDLATKQQQKQVKKTRSQQKHENYKREKELEDEVKKLSKNNLAEYKTPTMVVIHREPLPRTSTQKVKRKELLAWYEQN